jgi:hypothetical protein
MNRRKSNANRAMEAPSFRVGSPQFTLDDSIPFESRAEVFDGMCTRANTEESLSFGGMDHIEVFPVLRAMLDMIREGVII